MLRLALGWWVLRTEVTCVLSWVEPWKGTLGIIRQQQQSCWLNCFWKVLLRSQRASGLTQELVNTRIRATTLQTKCAREVSTCAGRERVLRSGSLPLRQGSPQPLIRLSNPILFSHNDWLHVFRHNNPYISSFSSFGPPACWIPTSVTFYWYTVLIGPPL